ncbi:MAG: hypothetical protein JWL84_530 [Rhodospirillales bacterium]|nr:hypothetical protein [Rhodospirillales bacterium]
MPHRIFLVHVNPPAMPPVLEAMRQGWPEALVFNLLDESLYAELDAEGTITPEIIRRIRLLLEYCVAARADGAIFSGSTFGPAVEAARQGLLIPILKADEAMVAAAVECGERIAVLGATERSIAVVSRGIAAAAAAAGRRITITPHWVAGATAAMASGRRDEHDRLVAAAVDRATGCDALVVSQISMIPAVFAVPPLPGRTILTSANTAVARLRALVTSSASPGG